jgi:hypothetical protein
MLRNTKSLVILAFIALATMGASQCVPTLADDPRVVVNVENVSNTYTITTGTTSFTGSNNCKTVTAAEYLDSEYGTVVGGRVVDIIYQTFGTFGANIINGGVTVNGVQILSYSGPWSTFTTRRSLITDNVITKNQAGVNALITAITNSQAIVICVTGTFSQAAPAGLQVFLDVTAQVDFIPD